MAQTVTECLSTAADSVTLINSINTDASAEPAVEGKTQAEINEMVQRNVDHLSAILLYAPDASDATDDTPNVAGATSSKKTTHVAAVTTGTAYIAAD